MSSGANGSSLTRPDSICARMSLSESSTQATYRFRYDVVAVVGAEARSSGTRSAQLRRQPRGCSSMAEHQLPKLTVRVRFPSPALTTKAQDREHDPGPVGGGEPGQRHRC